jgi:acyl-CoA oxidase
VEAGDIGPTHADYVNDNGYLGFKNFRVPRNSMLSKHFKVHPNGEYEMAIHPRLAYTGMMFVRSKMIFDCGIGLAAASIIAIRYSLIRRQGEIENG